MGRDGSGDDAGAVGGHAPLVNPGTKEGHDQPAHRHPTPAPPPPPRPSGAAGPPDRLDLDRGAGPSWVWVLLEALANAGAAFDPAAALARRWARIRDEELRPGRR
jgi:hypothetical protein